MGTVWRAHHPEAPGRPVAIKVLTATPGPEGLERFRREIQALVTAGGHPGVVQIIAGSLEARPPFYVMELIAGESLEATLERGPLEPRRAVEVVRAVADAIAFAHGHGILHRDLKPANVLLDTEGRARVCDFGIARLASAERMTRSGVFVGSPVWAAPEQLAGEAASIDARTDVHGLGALLWGALAGVSPYQRQIEQTGRRVIGGVPRVGSVAPGVPVELEAITACALEVDPALRYTTAAAFRDDLDRWQRGETPVAFVSWQKVAARGRRLGLIAVALLLALLIAVLAVAVLRSAARKERIAAALASVNRLGAPTSDLRAALAVLERDGARPEERALARESVRRRELEDRIAAVAPAHPGDTAPLEALESAALAAIQLPDRASLCGERAGRALGDALIDAHEAPRRGDPGDAHASAFLEHADHLATARLAASGSDPAAHLLRAKVALARAGAPYRPLGAGELGVPGALADPVRADLELAAADPGAPGVEADWLLVDLLAGSGPSGEAAARTALARARERHPTSSARPFLERALAATLDADGFLALTTELSRPDGVAAASLALSRFGARLGLPHLFEHPEAGATSTATRSPALDWKPDVAEALARAWTPTPPPQHKSTEASYAECVRVEGLLRPPLREVTPYEEVRATFEPAAAQALERYPNEPNLVAAAGERQRHRLSVCVWWLLANGLARIQCLPEIFEHFDRGYRRGSPDSDSVRDLFEAGAGVEGAAEFDRRLAREVVDDPILVAAQRHDAERVADAVLACGGIRRIEEIEEPPEDPRARAQLELDALRGLEAAVRVAPGPGLLFRARGRLAAIPAPLGPALARLDLLRLERFWRETADETLRWVEAKELASAVHQAASLAGRAGDLALEERLFQLGVRLAHAAAVARAQRVSDPAAVRGYLEEVTSLLELDPRFRGILLHDPKRAALMAPTADDRAQAARPEERGRGRTTRRSGATPGDGARLDRVELRQLEDGVTVHVECDAVNTGTTTWDDSYRLGLTIEAHDGVKDNAAALGEMNVLPPPGMFLRDGERVAPGESHAFAFDVGLPRARGTWDVTVSLDHFGASGFGPDETRSFQVTR